MSILSNLFVPPQLRKYCIIQNYDRYTSENQYTWRCIMQKLKKILTKNAHPLYLQGLKKTGITFEQIPRITDIDKKLQNLGWRAVSVSGFIPPSAFMEFQYYNILPIAINIRKIEHINYTPAPDIVHESAGHTPFLIDPVYRSFLKKSALVVKKAITYKQDYKQYSAIRKLSDLKEDPLSSAAEIKKSEQELNKINSELLFLSEAARLTRFIWWTAEYGLIGDIKKYKIYGAGLLSSIGESEKCFNPEIKKIPLDISCLEYSYDITNYQPQLFVTPSFEYLHTVLEEIKKTCSFYRGGVYGLTKAKQSEVICTIQLDSGLQISGILEDYLNQKEQVLFIKLKGACQLSYADKQLESHGVQQHSMGYSSPLGLLKNSQCPLHKMSFLEFKNNYVDKNNNVKLEFLSGFILTGKLINSICKENKLLILQFTNCSVSKENKSYYEPSWGVFDLALGEKVCSVFGGPADVIAYGETNNFEVMYGDKIAKKTQ